MPSPWPSLGYGAWSATCDTLHAHTQVLGKLAVELAPPEPQLQHAALRLSARGWETYALPAPDGSGAIVAALDLHASQVVVEHSAGHQTRITLTPNRPVAEVTREVLEAVGRPGGAVEIDPTPQEVPWPVPLDADHEHATYDADQVATYFEAATRAALVLGGSGLRSAVDPPPSTHGGGPSTSRSTSSRGGRPIHRPTTSSCATEPMPAGRDRVVAGRSEVRTRGILRLRIPHAGWLCGRDPQPGCGYWDGQLGEYVLDWEDIRESPDPHALALEFTRSAFRHACEVCEWDPELAASVDGVPPPIR